MMNILYFIYKVYLIKNYEFGGVLATAEFWPLQDDIAPEKQKEPYNTDLARNKIQ